MDTDVVFCMKLQPFVFVYTCTTFSGFVVFLLKHYEYKFSKASMYLYSEKKIRED